MSKKKNYFFIVFLFLSTEGLLGCIFVVQGPSCSGKSTIARALQAALCSEKTELIEFEKFRFEIWQKYLKKNYDYNLDASKDYLNSIMCIQELFGNEIFEYANACLAREETKAFHQAINDAMLNDRMLVIDLVSLLEEDWELLKQHKSYIVLLHCSFSTMLERLLLCNASENVYVQRYIEEPIETFLRLFKKSNEPADDIYKITLTREEIDNFFKKAIQLLECKNGYEGYAALCKMHEMKENYYVTFELTLGEQSLIRPCCYPHQVVSTENQTPEDCVEVILKGFLATYQQ